jgi:hypothetical protein
MKKKARQNFYYMEGAYRHELEEYRQENVSVALFRSVLADKLLQPFVYC